MLGDTYESPWPTSEQALQRQGGIEVQPGDAVIIPSAGKLYGKDNARFVKSTPGVGVGAAEWLAKQDPALVRFRQLAGRVSPNRTRT